MPITTVIGGKAATTIADQAQDVVSNIIDSAAGYYASASPGPQMPTPSPAAHSFREDGALFASLWTTVVFVMEVLALQMRAAEQWLVAAAGNLSFLPKPCVSGGTVAATWALAIVLVVGMVVSYRRIAHIMSCKMKVA